VGSEEGNGSECEARKGDTVRLDGVQTFSSAVQPTVRLLQCICRAEQTRWLSCGMAGMGRGED
jgi:hypothetical protein